MTGILPHKVAACVPQRQYIVDCKDENSSTRIQPEDGKSEAVKVQMRAKDLIRKINGEDKVAIGFRAGR
jgi:hypothetical protein